MEQHQQLAIKIAGILDNQFAVGKLRFGLDAFLDLIPYAGDIIILILSFYIIWVGAKMNLPRIAINRMIRNTLLGFIVGFIPVVGDIIFFTFRPNMRNAAIIQKFNPKT